jgi:outer membrane protein OmpA-like peptidoglycan-associated protein
MRVPTYIPLLLTVASMITVAPDRALAQAAAPVRKVAAAKPSLSTARLTDPKAITATEDEAGCVDSPSLARVAGCKILQCAKKAEDSVDVAVAATVEGLPREIEVDGASESIYYLCAGKDPAGDIVPVLQAALIKDSYNVAFSGKDKDDDSIISAHKFGQWIQISTYVYDGKPAYLQTILKATPEEFVSAEDFEDQFPATLRVFLPAVKFAVGKSAISPASEKVLTEIAGMLAKKIEWKLRIDGYAADGPDSATNMALAKARATAIVNWFAAHGIAKERLESNGFGDTVAIPEGKQRIELVKM